MVTAIDAHDPDDVFVQVPIPAGLDADVITESIPATSDVDVMTSAGYAAYMGDPHQLMPVPGGVGPMTVSALLERVVSFAADRRTVAD